jgi:hypothetical protein
VRPVSEIVQELEQRGVYLRVEGGGVKGSKPKNSPGDVMRALESLRSRKEEVLAFLESRKVAPCGSPHCAGCYEVAPGVRLHPPKASPAWLAWLARWSPSEKHKPQ